MDGATEETVEPILVEDGISEEELNAEDEVVWDIDETIDKELEISETEVVELKSPEDVEELSFTGDLS